MVRLVAGLVVAIAMTAVVGEAADPVPATPEQRLKALEGKWRVTWSIGGGAKTSFGDKDNPKLIQLISEDKATITILGNTLTAAGKETATLANDLDLPRGSNLENEVTKSTRGDHLLMLTLPSGRGLLASSFVEDGQLMIRYPAGCCSRSGAVIRLERIKD